MAMVANQYDLAIERTKWQFLTKNILFHMLSSHLLTKTVWWEDLSKGSLYRELSLRGDEKKDATETIL